MIKRFFVFLLSFFFFIGGTLATAQAASVVAADDVTVISYDDDISVTSLGDYGNLSIALYESSTNSTVATLSFDSAYSNNTSSYFSSFAGYGFDTIRIYVLLDSPLEIANYNINFSIIWNSVSQFDLNSCTITPINIVSGTAGYRMVNTPISSSFSSYSTRMTWNVNFDNVYGSQVLLLEIWSPDTIEIVSGAFELSAISISTSSEVDLTETNNLISTSNSLLNNIISSLSSVISAIISLPQKIIDLFITAMESLFIPSDDYFTTKFNELFDLFDEKLGFLMYPTEIFSSFVNALQASSDGFTIEFPAFSLDVGGSSYQVWDKYVFNFDDIKENFPEIFSAAEIIFTVILCGYSINLIITYYDVVVWGSSSTALVEQGGRDDY